MRILKHHIDIGRTSLMLPKGAQVLSANYQKKCFCIWILADSSQPLTKRSFVIQATGFDEPMSGWKHIDTFLIHDGEEVWHAFEVPNL